MGLLPNMLNYGLSMHWECWERFPRHWLQMKPLLSDPGMHHGTCVSYVPWCMSGSLTRGGGGNVPGTPSACATCNFTYLVTDPCIYVQCHDVMSWKRVPRYGPFVGGSSLSHRWIPLTGFLSQRASRNAESASVTSETWCGFARRIC